MCLDTVRWNSVGTDTGGIEPIPRSSILSLTASVAVVAVYESADKSWSGPIHKNN